MGKGQITEELMFIILKFINENYSVVREGYNGLATVDIENLYHDIFENLNDKNNLTQYLLLKEGDLQVDDFDSVFELSDWMISNIKYQTKFFNPDNLLSKVNQYAKTRLIEEGKIDKAMANISEAKRLATEREEKEKHDNERRVVVSVGYIYLIKSNYGFKIGKSQNIKQRSKLFGVLMPFKFDYIFKKKCKDYHNLELKLHEMFEHKNLNGEWFQLSEDDINMIIEEVAKYEVKDTLS